MTNKVWHGEEWETYVRRLLLRRYAPGEYQQIPDRHIGDYGLDGFSADGIAYQCYAPEEPLTVDQRYEKCRAKVTADIGKFIRNRDHLQRLLGGIQIRRWVLVTPRHDSARLIQHCARKRAQVLEAHLPYVAPDFQILVITDEAFQLEARQLAGVGLAQIHLPHDTPTPEAPDAWLANSANVTFVANLSRKSLAIPTLSRDASRDAFIREMVGLFLEGQAILGHLHDKYPELYEQVLRLKAAREKALTVESLAGVSGLPGDRLKSELDDFRASLHDALSGLSPTMVTGLALEAVADWLMRCPLDFPGEGDVGS